MQVEYLFDLEFNGITQFWPISISANSEYEYKCDREIKRTLQHQSMRSVQEWYRNLSESTR